MSDIQGESQTTTTETSAADDGAEIFDSMLDQGGKDKAGASDADAADATSSKQAAAADGDDVFLNEDQAQDQDKADQETPEGFVKLLGDDATDEDKAAFNAALGVPDSAEGYELDVPEGFEGADHLKALAHQLSLRPDQAQAMLDAVVSDGKQQQEAYQQFVAKQLSDTKAALEKEWGGEAVEKVRAAGRAIRQVGGSELVEVLKNANVLNTPEVIRAFDKIGGFYKEDKAPGSSGSGGTKKSLLDRLYPNPKEEG